MELYQDKEWLRRKYEIEELSSLKIGKICSVSGEVIRRRMAKFNIKCRKPGFMEGEKNSNWKGGIKNSSDGYVYLWQANHPPYVSVSYIAEHRLIMEKHLGRYLRRDEIVHHINGIRNDNRIENLELTDADRHNRKRKIRKAICPKCKHEFLLNKEDNS